MKEKTPFFEKPSGIIRSITGIFWNWMSDGMTHDGLPANTSGANAVKRNGISANLKFFILK
jgi:hypothetical protein